MLGSLLLALAGYGSLPTADQCGVRVERGRAVAAEHYDRMLGFAAVARTSGGLGRPFYLVTRSDDGPGRGTLRSAVEAAKSGGGWIGFSPGLRGQTVRLDKPIRVGRDTTIDGGCSHPTIEASGNGSLFYVQNTDNVVISRLNLQQVGDWEGGDCVTVSHGSDRVWVANNRIQRCRDGLVDVTRNGGKTMHVTISNNWFADHDKAILIDDVTEPGRCNAAPGVNVTLFRNRFVNTGQRHPRVHGNALVHAAQNVITYTQQRRRDGTLGGSSGMAATDGARLLAEDDVFDPRGSKPLRLVSTAPDRAPAPCGEATIEVVRGARIGAGEQPASSGAPRRIAIPYRLPAAPNGGTEQLIRTVEREAGPGGQ